MKDPNVKFHENPANGSSTDTCGQTYGPTDVKELLGAFLFVRVIKRHLLSCNGDVLVPAKAVRGQEHLFIPRVATETSHIIIHPTISTVAG